MRFRISHVFRLMLIDADRFICICLTAISCAAFGSAVCVKVQEEQESDNSIADVLPSIIQIPRGDTNVLYYAGSSGKKAIVIHVTSTGERKWEMQNANLDQDVIMPYTEERDKWVLLKETGGDRLHHWNWRQEIKDFIQRFPRKSAVVSQVSSWYQVDDDTSNMLWVVDSFVVEETLCETLKHGDKICTVRLFDGPAEERRRILSEARKKNVKIINGRFDPQALKCACWDAAKIAHVGGLLTETALCIDTEIVAPLKFQWNCIYDELLPFEEAFAISAYKKRARRSEEANNNETAQFVGCFKDGADTTSRDVASSNPAVNELLSHLNTLRVGPYDFNDMRWSDMVGKITEDARRALRETGFEYSFGFSGGPGLCDPQKEIGTLHIPRTSPYEAFRLVAERFGGKIWYERGVIWMISKDRERPNWSD